MPPPTHIPQFTGELHILFIRHGETQDNIDKILQGQRDTLLTLKGFNEAQTLSEKMRSQQIDIIYHSPLQRMIQTIQPLVDTRPGIATHADPDLKGQYLGSLEGGSYDVIDMNNPCSADPQPGVEQFDDFVRRLKRVLARIIGVEASRIGSSSAQNRTVVIATHGVGLTSLFRALNAVPPYDNFNVRLAERGPDAYEVRWTDSDDVSRLIVRRPAELPVKDGVLVWEDVEGMPFLIEYWDKREKTVCQ